VPEAFRRCDSENGLSEANYRVGSLGGAGLYALTTGHLRATNDVCGDAGTDDPRADDVEGDAANKPSLETALRVIQRKRDGVAK
jgi:hypothetical protein